MSETKLHEVVGRRPTWAEIDLDALASNLKIVKAHVGADVNVMAVVKANGYGHGAVECAKRLEATDADWFGVALPEEGFELRNAGITRPILCLAGFWEGQAEACLRHKLVPAVYRLDMIAALDLAARERAEVADVHVKIDTGMGRLGVRFDEVNAFADALKRFKNIRVDGLMTHFAAADEPSCGPLTTGTRLRALSTRSPRFAKKDINRAIVTFQIPPASLLNLPHQEVRERRREQTWCVLAASCMDFGVTYSIPSIAIKTSNL